jgi:Domain of unknown function (DUF3784)
MSAPPWRVSPVDRTFYSGGIKILAAIFVFVFTLVLMVSLGIVFSLGKGSSLIAGFNTLPEEEKEKYEVVALCKFMGKMMFALSFCVVLWLISVVYEINWLLYFGIALSIGITIFILLYVNTGNRFKKV